MSETAKLRDTGGGQELRREQLEDGEEIGTLW
jgi:hypothetical protein